MLFALLFIYANNLLGQNLISGIEGQSTYYEVASEIKQVYPELDIISSGGSVESLNKLCSDSSEVNLAMVQYDALLIKQLIKPEIKQKIEIVLPLYREELHLITKSSNNIDSISDLEGKIVAIGSASQGTNVTAKLIISELGIECDEIEIAFKDAFAALLNDKVDAFFIVGGAPLENLASFPKEVNSLIKMIPVDRPELHDIYKPAIIKAGTYPWLQTDINTVYVQSYIVTNNTKETNIDEFLTAIQENIEVFKTDQEHHMKWVEVSFNTELPDWPVNTIASKYLK